MSNADNKNNMMEGEIVVCSHFWCMQVFEALNQHAYLVEPQGLGLSPGGVPLQTEVIGNSVAACY